MRLRRSDGRPVSPPASEIVLIDTAGKRAGTDPVTPGGTIPLEQRSLVVLCQHNPTPEEVDHSVAASLSAMVAATKEEAPAPKAEAGR